MYSVYNVNVCNYKYPHIGSIGHAMPQWGVKRGTKWRRFTKTCMFLCFHVNIKAQKHAFPCTLRPTFTPIIIESTGCSADNCESCTGVPAVCTGCNPGYQLDSDSLACGKLYTLQQL